LLTAKETIVFEDETGFTLHPRLGRGWCKVGQRLRVLTTSQHQKRLNIFGWVAPLLGRMGMLTCPQGNRDGFLDCLRQLYRRLRGYKIWLYVDGAKWHKGEDVRIFLRTHKRIRLVYLPPYQPGLNAQERVWRQVRYEATTNRWFESLDFIWETVQRTTQSWTKAKLKGLCKIT
jgi:transposase